MTKLRLFVVVALGLTLVAGTSAAGASQQTQLGKLRHATARFHSIATAEQHNFGLLTDTKGIACIDMPGMGGMGVHYVKSVRVGNPVEHLAKPEALVYAPARTARSSSPRSSTSCCGRPGTPTTPDVRASSGTGST